RGVQPNEGLAAREDPYAFCRSTALAVPGSSRFLAFAVGQPLTTMVFALGERPVMLLTAAHAPLLEVLAAAEADGARPTELVPGLRTAAGLALAEARVGVMRLVRCELVAASRIARAVVTLASDG